MTQQKIARMKRLPLEAGAVTRDNEPVADLVSQQLNPADRRKFAAKSWICRARAIRKNKPNAIVLRRFCMLSEHTNDAIAQVDGKTGKHATHLGVQGHQGVQNKRVRSLLFWFGRTRRHLSPLKCSDPRRRESALSKPSRSPCRLRGSRWRASSSPQGWN